MHCIFRLQIFELFTKIFIRFIQNWKLYSEKEYKIINRSTRVNLSRTNLLFKAILKLNEMNWMLNILSRELAESLKSWQEKYVFQKTDDQVGEEQWTWRDEGLRGDRGQANERSRVYALDSLGNFMIGRVCVTIASDTRYTNRVNRKTFAFVRNTDDTSGFFIRVWDRLFVDFMVDAVSWWPLLFRDILFAYYIRFCFFVAKEKKSGSKLNFGSFYS